MKVEKKHVCWIGIGAFLLFLAVYYWETFVGIVGLAFKAATPLLIGCVMTYILNILMSFYEKHYFPKKNNPAVQKSRRLVCMLGAFLTMLAIVVLVIRLVIPELTACVKLLFAGIPGVMSSFADWIAKSEIVSEEIVSALEGIDWQAALTKILNILSSGIDSTVNFTMGLVSSTISVVMNFVIGGIFSIYLLTGKERILAQCSRVMKNYMKPSWNTRLRYVLSVANDCFHKYIVGQFTEAIILGALCALGMLLLGFPYAAMTGVVIGVTALIPVAGAYIGGAVGFFLILSKNFSQAIMFLVYLVILQQLEGNLIYPRVVGNSIGLPGMWVLAVVTVGGGIWGIPGMLLGVPLAATVYQLLRNDMNKKEKHLLEVK